MQHNISILNQWINKWGMQIGIEKCGIWSSDDDTHLDLLANPLSIDGSDIPVVTSYEYLGVKF